MTFSSWHTLFVLYIITVNYSNASISKPDPRWWKPGAYTAQQPPQFLQPLWVDYAQGTLENAETQPAAPAAPLSPPAPVQGFQGAGKFYPTPPPPPPSPPPPLPPPPPAPAKGNEHSNMVAKDFLNPLSQATPYVMAPNYSDIRNIEEQKRYASLYGQQEHFKDIKSKLVTSTASVQEPSKSKLVTSTSSVQEPSNSDVKFDRFKSTTDTVLKHNDKASTIVSNGELNPVEKAMLSDSVKRRLLEEKERLKLMNYPTDGYVSSDGLIRFSKEKHNSNLNKEQLSKNLEMKFLEAEDKKMFQINLQKIERLSSNTTTDGQEEEKKEADIKVTPELILKSQKKKEAEIKVTPELILKSQKAAQATRDEELQNKRREQTKDDKLEITNDKLQQKHMRFAGNEVASPKGMMEFQYFDAKRPPPWLQPPWNSQNA